MRLISFGLSVATGVVLAQGTMEIAGPDGTVRFFLSADAQGHLQYQISSGGQARFEPAPMGIIVDGQDLGAGAVWGVAPPRSVSEVFPWRGLKTSATNRCQAVQIPMRSQPNGQEWTLEVRVFNDGAAFRFRVPGESMRRVGGESTAWQLPAGSTVWLQTDTDDYEGVYHSCPADRVPLDETVDGKQRPTYVGLPMTIVYSDGAFGLVTEAGLSRYSGVTLRPAGSARFQAAFEDDPKGWPETGLILSPWRVAVLTRDLNSLVNSDMVAALAEPPDPRLFPEGMNTPWLRPGKAPCTWMVFGNDGAQWDKQKWFVDLCAATGCEYLLVDAGWRSERWGWLKDGGDLWGRTAELCRYAAERKVGIVLWHSFPEGRDDGPGLTSIEAREELFRNCQKAGVKGVKIDFFNSESRAVIGAYEDLLQRAAKYQLLVNFHGANKPTGEARTWPNEITREGIREQEYVLWGELPLGHYGALPFTRMAVGHADFLPGYVQPRLLKNTTAIFQMAAVVVFSSPFLCWPDNPEAYLHSPLLSFVRNAPVTWDETRVLPGSVIGDTVIYARRKDTEWYLAILNCRNERRHLDVDLAGLDLAGKAMTLYRDGTSKGSVNVETGLSVPTNGRLSVALLPGGGALARFAPPNEYAGW